MKNKVETAKCCGTCGMCCIYCDGEYGHIISYHCALKEKPLNSELTSSYNYLSDKSSVNQYEVRDCWEKLIEYGRGNNCFNCLHWEDCPDRKTDPKYFCGRWQQGIQVAPLDNPKSRS